MLRTVADTIIAGFILIVVLTGVSGVVFKRVGQLVFEKWLGRVWRQISEPARQARSAEERNLQAAAARRERIRAATAALTESVMTYATERERQQRSGMMNPAQERASMEAVVNAQGAITSLKLDCPELTGHLDAVGGQLGNVPLLVPRARELLEPVVQGAQQAIAGS